MLARRRTLVQAHVVLTAEGSRGGNVTGAHLPVYTPPTAGFSSANCGPVEFLHVGIGNVLADHCTLSTDTLISVAVHSILYAT
jgi:hypothetical protein